MCINQSIGMMLTLTTNVRNLYVHICHPGKVVQCTDVWLSPSSKIMNQKVN